MKQWICSTISLLKTVCISCVVLACSQLGAAESTTDNPLSTPTEDVPEELAMGGAKSVTSFFITSRGLGSGANLGGLRRRRCALPGAGGGRICGRPYLARLSQHHGEGQ